MTQTKRKAIRCLAVSDLHGHLPSITRSADVLFVAGDIVPLNIQRNTDLSANWLIETFGAWVKQLKVEHVVATWGNHDWVGQLCPDLKHYLPFTVLVDEHKVITFSDGRRLSVYGSPWTPEFMNWAFNLPRGEEIRARWTKIPEGLDVLMTHGPAQGILDDTGALMIGGMVGGSFGRVEAAGRFVGCRDLHDRITAMAEPPKVHLFGHIHGAHGKRQIGGLRFFNVSLCDERYRPVNPVTEFEV